MAGNENGGPAFPCGAAGGCGPWGGMTLRDWLAGQAIVGILANDLDNRYIDARANIAYAYADAMLAERTRNAI